MSNRSVARTERANTREQRGLALARERGHEIWKVGPAKWRVPSCTTETVYIVSLEPEFCPCEDHVRTGATCKHVYAALTVRAKTAACEGCGLRFRRRELVEVGPEQVTYGHDVREGERYCRSCATDRGIR